MNMQRDTRRAALQALYQLDSNGEDHLDMIRESLVEGREESSSIDDGLELARQVWQRREDADAAVLSGIGVCAGHQVAPVRPVGAARPYLCPVENKVVAVPDGPQLQRRQV